MKEREWNVEALAAKLRKQVAWESTKRDIVLESVRTDSLEKKMTTAANRAGHPENDCVRL